MQIKILMGLSHTGKVTEVQTGKWKNRRAVAQRSQTSYIQSRRELLLPYLRKTTPDIWRMVTFFAAQFYKNSGWTFLGSLLLNGEAGFNGDLKQFSKCFKLQGGLCQT